MALSYIDIIILTLCAVIGGGVRYFSVPIYSCIEEEEYLYLGRVFLWIIKDSYSIRIPYWFIDKSVTTKFVVSLPTYFKKKNEYSEMSVKTKEKEQVIFIREEAVFYV